MITETIHGELLAQKLGQYTIYVFKTSDNKLIMCTKLPNWGFYDIKIGDVGFLTYNVIIAGETYYDSNTGETKKYKYSNIYFKDFIKDIKDVSTEIIL